MKAPSGTDPELIEEIGALRKRIRELEKREKELSLREEKLRLSRQQLRLLIDAGPDFFFLKDLDLRYQLVNLANARFFGLPETGILGRTDGDLMPEEAASACRGSDLQAIHERRIVITVEKVGDQTYETYKFPVIVSGKVVGVAGIIRDITDRTKAEEALRRSEELQNTILSNVGAHIFLKDTDYRYTYVNSMVCSLFGSPREDIVGKDDNAFFSPESVKEIMESDRRVIENGETITREEIDLTSRTSPVPRTYWAVKLPLRDKDGKIFGLCGISTDITALRQAEEALKVSERRLSDIIEFLPDATFAIDLEGRIITWNKAIEEMTGFSEEVMLGKDNHEYAIPFYGKRRPALVDLLFSWNDVTAKKYPFIKKVGDCLYGEADVTIAGHGIRTTWIKASFLRNARGDVVGGIESIRDITDRKALESQLLQAQKMEAVGSLAGGVAHDFNNILMGIQGYASLTLLDLGPDDPSCENLRQIEQLVHSASDLTRQLLGFARGGRYELRPTDMNEIVRASSAMFARTKKELTVHGKYDEDLGSVEVDRGQIEQVLLNLYVNAWHAMPAGGEIYLETGNTVIDEVLAAAHDVSPGEYVRVSVADTGIGMEEETRKRIFDPFFTTREMGRGTGLGLAMVYGIMKGHKGFVDVTSEPGRGTTFFLHFPVTGKEVSEERPAPAEMLKGSETVLLVEDEPGVRRVSRKILESLGYSVHDVEGGREALAFLESTKNQVDLVILDMIMPGLSGAETFDRIRKLHPSMKIILSSGYSLNGEARRIMEKGCSGFIQKPFDIALLSKKMREALSG